MGYGVFSLELSPMSEPTLKFVLIDEHYRAFSMLVDGNLHMVSQYCPLLMRTFDAEIEAVLFQQQLWQESGHWLTVGFVDYCEQMPFVESCEFLYRGDI